MHMLWCVFEHAVSQSVFMDAVDRQCLETSPTEGEYERIAGFKNLQLEGESAKGLKLRVCTWKCVPSCAIDVSCCEPEHSRNVLP